jgi:predicted Zn-dependent protease
VLEQDILGEIQRQLVDVPIIERLGLTEAHFSASYAKAMEKLETGDIPAAFRDIAGLVLMAPTSVQFQLGLAQVALQAGVPELAMQAAAAIIALAPDRPEGFLLSGQACLAMGEPALAREDLADAIALADKNPRYAALGRIARQSLILTESS